MNPVVPFSNSSSSSSSSSSRPHNISHLLHDVDPDTDPEGFAANQRLQNNFDNLQAAFNETHGISCDTPPKLYYTNDPEYYFIKKALRKYGYGTGFRPGMEVEARLKSLTDRTGDRLDRARSSALRTASSVSNYFWGTTPSTIRPEDRSVPVSSVDGSSSNDIQKLEQEVGKVRGINIIKRIKGMISRTFKSGDIPELKEPKMYIIPFKKGTNEPSYDDETEIDLAPISGLWEFQIIRAYACPSGDTSDDTIGDISLSSSNRTLDGGPTDSVRAVYGDGVSSQGIGDINLHSERTLDDGMNDDVRTVYGDGSSLKIINLSAKTIDGTGGKPKYRKNIRKSKKHNAKKLKSHKKSHKKSHNKSHNKSHKKSKSTRKK